MTPPTSVLMVHPSTELYGSDRMFLEAVEGFREAGLRVVVAVPDTGPLVDRLLDSGVRVLRCPTPVLRKSALRPLGLLRLLAHACSATISALRLLRHERVQAVYVSTVTIPLWPLLARLTGHRVLAHVHEAETDAPRIIRTALALPLAATDSVVVNSAASAEVLHDCLPRLRGRTRIVYNAVAGPHVVPDKKVTLGDPVRLVLVGRISPRKGTDIAVRAAAELRARGHRVRLDLVGSVFAGYEWFRERLDELIATHDLRDIVTFRGFSPDVWDHYADADIALVPSRYEPFGNTAVEAQLSRTPVVVSDVQGLPETIGGGKRGRIVPPEDPVALAETVESLLAHWENTRKVTESAERDARRCFAPERYRHTLYALMRDLGHSRRHGLSRRRAW